MLLALRSLVETDQFVYGNIFRLDIPARGSVFFIESRDRAFVIDERGHIFTVSN